MKIENISLSSDKENVIILDQTQLPNRTEYLTLGTVEEMYDAIFHLKVRGAPAIGIFAAYGLYCLICSVCGLSGKLKTYGSKFKLGAWPDEACSGKEQGMFCGGNCRAFGKGSRENTERRYGYVPENCGIWSDAY